jgi:uncharacterized protein (TIGR03067 family)
MRFWLLTTAALALSGGCNPVDNYSVERELERLQGTWIGLSYTDAQHTVDGGQMAMSLVITGADYRVRFNDQVIAQGKLVLDPTRAPRIIDFREDQQTGTGIYEPTGTACAFATMGLGRSDRPNSKSSRAAPSAYLFSSGSLPILVDSQAADYFQSLSAFLIFRCVSVVDLIIILPLK